MIETGTDAAHLWSAGLTCTSPGFSPKSSQTGVGRTLALAFSGNPDNGVKCILLLGLPEWLSETHPCLLSQFLVALLFSGAEM